MQKFYYNFYLLIKNFKKYGPMNIFLIVLFELIYTLKLLDLKTNFFEKNNFLYKKNKNKKNTYNAAYTPTPYYFLHLINNFFLSEKINLHKYYIIDFGCGYGRVFKFFEFKFKKFIGIDINKKYINHLKTKYKSDYFINTDLRNYKKIIKKLNALTKNKKKILYFYEPFEDALVRKIAKSCLRSGDKCIIVNIRNFNVLKSFKTLYKKILGEKSKNILIIKLPK